MKKKLSICRSVILLVMLILCISNADANTISPEITLEAENGDLIGDFMHQKEEGSTEFILVSNPSSNQKISIILDIPLDENYEFWVRMRGTSKGAISLLSNNREIYRDYFIGKNNYWHWIKLPNNKRLPSGRYYLVLSDLTGIMEIDKIVVKKDHNNETTVSRNNIDSFSTMSTSSSGAPTFSIESPWTKQGLNPFSSYMQNGQELVSTTSGLLTVSATDIIIPGRGGLDFAITRNYTSKPTFFGSGRVKDDPTYFIGDWDFGFPRATKTSVSFSNGSECNLQDDEVIEDVIRLDNGDKIYTYINGVTKYFRLERYEKKINEILTIPIYEVQKYDLYLADGTHYVFDGEGKITHIYSKNSQSNIIFTYDNNDRISTITDTRDLTYTFTWNDSDIKIKREDGKVLVKYVYQGDQLKQVTDSLGRKTSYQYERPGITKIIYPSDKISSFEYGSSSHNYFEQEFGEPVEKTYYVYWLTKHKISLIEDGNLVQVKRIDYNYDFERISDREIRYIYAETYDENDLLKLTTYYNQDDYGMQVRSKTIDENTQKVLQTIYIDYSTNKRMTKQRIFEGNIYEDQYDNYIHHSAIDVEPTNYSNSTALNGKLLKEEEWQYDQWGNQVYYKDPEGYETMTSFVNSNYDTSFYRISVGNAGSTAFYDNSSVSGKHIYNLPSGSLRIRKYSGSQNEFFEADETYYKYDQQGQIVESKKFIINDNGSHEWFKTQYNEYDLFGNCQQIIFDADSANPIIEDYEYDEEYNHAYVTSQKQYPVTHFLEDGIAFSSPVTTKFKYDFYTGQQTKVINPDNVYISYEYDDLGRTIRMSYPQEFLSTPESWVGVVYDDNSNMTLKYDAEKKNFMVHYFDGLGRTKKVEQYVDINDILNTIIASGEIKNNLEQSNITCESKVSSVYNWQNQIISTTDENEKITTFEYDLLGRKTKMITDDGIVTTFEYSDLEYKTIIDNPNSTRNIVITDKKGQVIEQSIKKILNGTVVDTVTNYSEYDGYGNVVKTIDPKGQEMGYEYNHLGQLIQIKYPNSQGQVNVSHPVSLTEFNFYSPRGNLIRTQNRNGDNIYYQYNEYNQLIKVDLPVSEDIDYYYDKMGQLVKINQGTKYTKIFDYDIRGRKIEEKLIIDPESNNSREYTTGYTFTENNRYEDIIYPDSSTLTYGYNALDQINKVTWNGNELVNSIDYNVMGTIDSIYYGNGVMGEYNYNYVNGSYLPDNIDFHKNGEHFGVYDYRYDVMGNIIRSNSYLYEYDYLNQLVGWKYFKDNDKVLLGEELIWEDNMQDHLGLNLSQTYVTHNANTDQLQLALDINQDLIKASKLTDIGELSFVSGLDRSLVTGYQLNEDEYKRDEDFNNNIVLENTSANISNGTVSLPYTETSTRWTIYTTRSNISLPKNNLDSVNISLGSKRYHTTYSGIDYEESRSWVPPTSDSINWHPIGSGYSISKSSIENVKTLKFKVDCTLINYWKLFGGWGNWTLHVMMKINGKVVDEVKKFETNAVVEEIQSQTFTVDLEDEGLMNRDLDIDLYYVRNKWGAGIVSNGYLEDMTVTASEKYYYPTSSVTKEYSLYLYDNVNYKLEATQNIPLGTSITYKLYKGTTYIQTISNNGTFSNNQNGTGNYKLKVILDTNKKTITPTVDLLRIYKEKKYISSATIQLDDISMEDLITHVDIAPSADTPTGTTIYYYISGNGGSTWTRLSQNGIRYSGNLSVPSNQLSIKAILKSSFHRALTPYLYSMDIYIPELDRYITSGQLTTSSFQTPEPASDLVLELHGDKNSGSLYVTLDINGETIVGEATTTSALIDGMSGDGGLNSETQLPGEMTVQEKAEAIRSEISMTNLSTYYYTFDIPESLENQAISGKFQIKLSANSDKTQSPVVYSYILMQNYFRYYQTGTFKTETIRPDCNYSYDQIKLNAEVTKPSGTSINYEISSYGLAGDTTPTDPGVITQLPIDTEYMKINGVLETNDTTKTPAIRKLEAYAVGETPFQNDVESADIVTLSETISGLNTLSESTDRVVGNRSILVDQTAVNSYGYYLIKSSKVFDATKLPYLEIWIKPLDEGAISFAVYDNKDLRSERIINDLDGDQLFEVGQDLILNKWNRVVLDLSKTQYNGMSNKSSNLYIIVHGGNTKFLFDGIRALPENNVTYVYDDAGNRTDLIENDVLTTYQYEPGTNRLKSRHTDKGNEHLDDVFYQYDYNGNLIRQEILPVGKEAVVFEYTFNELNQLIKVEKNNQTLVEYAYDESGLRYKKIDYVNDQTIIYVYGAGYEPIYEEIFSGTTSSSISQQDEICYLNMAGIRIAKDDESGLKYYYTDHLGNIRAVKLENGHIVKYNYRPFGGELSYNSTEKFKFNGKEFDESLDLYYYNSRYYDPKIGRFISEDIAKEEANWYVYVLNNPLKYIDPDGRNQTESIWNRRAIGWTDDGKIDFIAYGTVTGSYKIFAGGDTGEGPTGKVSILNGGISYEMEVTFSVSIEYLENGNINIFFVATGDSKDYKSSFLFLKYAISDEYIEDFECWTPVCFVPGRESIREYWMEPDKVLFEKLFTINANESFDLFVQLSPNLKDGGLNFTFPINTKKSRRTLNLRIKTADEIMNML